MYNSIDQNDLKEIDLELINDLIYRTASYNHKTALEIFNKSKNYFNQSKNEEEYFLFKLNLAHIYTFSGHKYDSYKLFNEIDSLYDESFMTKAKVTYFLEKAILHRDDNTESHAIDNLLQAIELAEKSNDKVLIIKTYNTFSQFYLRLKRFKEATNFQKKALEISKTLDDSLYLSICYNNLGISYYYQNKDSIAEVFFTQALEIAKEIDFEHLCSLIYNNLGGISFNEKKYTETLEFLNKALVIDKKYDDYEGIVTVIKNILNIKYANKLFDSYEELALEAILIAENEKLAEKKMFLLELLANYYYKVNEFKKSSETFIKYDKLRDSLWVASTTIEINEITEKFGAERKEKENQILKIQIENQKLNAYFYIVVGIFLVTSLVFFIKRYLDKQKFSKELLKQNKEIESTNNELKTLIEKLAKNEIILKKTLEDLEVSNKAKAQLMSILIHDIKSPLQAQLLSAEILSTIAKKQDNEKLIKRSNIILKTTDNIIELINDIYTWFRTQSDNIEFIPETCNMKEIFEECHKMFLNQLEEKNISCIYDKNIQIQIIADKIMIQTVLNHLVSNAIKFSNDNSNIEIISIEAEKHIQTSVVDHGHGMSEEIKQELLSPAKIVNSNGNVPINKGIGLLICNEFLKKHNGNIWVESEIGKGTSVHFTLPK